MSPSGLLEALRFGSRRDYDTERARPLRPRAQDRFVLAVPPSDRRDPDRAQAAHVPRHDARPRLHRATRLLERPGRRAQRAIDRAKRSCTTAPGRSSSGRTLTVSCPSDTPKRLGPTATRTHWPSEDGEHLSMVFHRFIAGDAWTRARWPSRVNGEKLTAWDPFASDEAAHRALAPADLRGRVGRGLVGRHASLGTSCHPATSSPPPRSSSACPAR